MKRYILTSSRFGGHIILVYSEAGDLRAIDATPWDGDAGAAAYLFNHLPRKLALLDDFITNTLQTATLVEEAIVITFDMFWNKYAVKRNRKRCEAIWQKLPKAKQVKAFVGVARYDRFLTQLEWKRNKLDPDSYLSGERWEDAWQ